MKKYSDMSWKVSSWAKGSQDNIDYILSCFSDATYSFLLNRLFPSDHLLHCSFPICPGTGRTRVRNGSGWLFRCCRPQRCQLACSDSTQTRPTPSMFTPLTRVASGGCQLRCSPEPKAKARLTAHSFHFQAIQFFIFIDVFFCLHFYCLFQLTSLTPFFAGLGHEAYLGSTMPSYPDGSTYIPPYVKPIGQYCKNFSFFFNRNMLNWALICRKEVENLIIFTKMWIFKRIHDYSLFFQILGLFRGLSFIEDIRMRAPYFCIQEPGFWLHAEGYELWR